MHSSWIKEALLLVLLLILLPLINTQHPVPATIFCLAPSPCTLVAAHPVRRPPVGAVLVRQSAAEALVADLGSEMLPLFGPLGVGRAENTARVVGHLFSNPLFAVATA